MCISGYFLFLFICLSVCWEKLSHQQNIFHEKYFYLKIKKMLLVSVPFGSCKMANIKVISYMVIGVHNN